MYKVGVVFLFLYGEVVEVVVFGIFVGVGYLLGDIDFVGLWFGLYIFGGWLYYFYVYGFEGS